MIGDRKSYRAAPGQDCGPAEGILTPLPVRAPAVCSTEVDMAHLWVREPGAGEWSPVPLADDPPPIHPAMLLRRPRTEPDVWVVIGSPAVHVNGVPLDAGIRVLRDRDELRVDGHQIGRAHV